MPNVGSRDGGKVLGPVRASVELAHEELKGGVVAFVAWWGEAPGTVEGGIEVEGWSAGGVVVSGSDGGIEEGSWPWICSTRGERLLFRRSICIAVA